MRAETGTVILPHVSPQAQAHADTTSIFIDSHGSDAGWSQRLRQHTDALDPGRLGKTEYQWKAR